GGACEDGGDDVDGMKVVTRCGVVEMTMMMASFGDGGDDGDGCDVDCWRGEADGGGGRSWPERRRIFLKREESVARV
ncbi:hypothetical protein Tco_1187819, partial [Tanacetum coccineum]